VLEANLFKKASISLTQYVKISEQMSLPYVTRQTYFNLSLLKRLNTIDKYLFYSVF